MSNNTVQYTINVVGNAEQVINSISQSAVTATSRVSSFSMSMEKIRDAGLAFETVNNMFGKLTGMLDSCTAANNVQQEAETKLAQVMRNTMDASADEIQAIKDLASAQQMLGVVGDEVQLSGAQELGTYLEKTDSLKKLLPVMNDMLAQQYGLNATQEQAVTIGSMMGKVMEGQVGALSRYGYKFDEAQEKILKYGTEEERVATLAEVIEQSVGGMNAALAATPEGVIKQTENNIGDLQERIGALWVQIRSGLMPTVERLLSIANNVIGFFEEHQVLFGALAAAIGAIIAVTKGWVIVQGILNVVMSMNPVGAIIMLIVALITAIVSVVSKTEGWGETWNNTMEYLKLTFEQCGVWLHKKWLEIENFFMTGFETIATGWYKLQSLWDSDAANDGLAKIERQRDERAKAIAEAQGKLDELAEARKSIDIWQVKWKDKKEENTEQVPGTMASLMKTVNGGLDASSGSGIGESLSKSATATATGGTRNTEIKISLGKMVENINFNGGLEENETDMEQRLAEMLARILGMAETTAG